MTAETSPSERLEGINEFDWPDEKRLPDRSFVELLVAQTVTKHLAQKKVNAYSSLVGSQVIQNTEAEKLEDTIVELNKTEQELEALKLVAIEQINLSTEEKKLIHKTSQDLSTLNKFLYGVDKTKLSQAYEQYLTGFIKYTIFYGNSHSCLDNVEKTFNPFFAPELTKIFGEKYVPLPRYQQAVILQTEESLSNIIFSVRKDEFLELDEFDPNDYDSTPDEISLLKQLAWKENPDINFSQELVSFWESLSKTDKGDSVNDPTGYETTLALLRFRGCTQTQQLEALGRAFSRIIQEANFGEYKQQIGVATSS